MQLSHPGVAQDLLGGFTTADAAAPQRNMREFLDGVDAVPAFRWYKRKLRELLDLRPGETLLDIGCGNGTEACRFAQEYPAVQVLGLDRAAMLTEAARRSEHLGVTVNWIPGEAEAIPLPARSVDACMTERVLKYVPDPARAVTEMVRVLRPGGRIACFELDTAATVFGGDPVAASLVCDLLCSKLSEPRMGRRLPMLLHKAGLADVTHRPVVFHMPSALNDAIAYQPVRQAIADGTLPRTVNDWLDEQGVAAAHGLFTIGWVGWLVSGHLAAPEPTSA
jgi:ubiquinone/menaquinone biosynthesis C-methylase UbiE